jgi:prepilin-type N-terminal cleavage/methylation domain-containing protein
MQLKRDERGVTLVEVLVAVIILGIIAAPLATGMWVFFRNSDETTRRLSDSHDAQMLANYFAQDVQAMGVRDWSAAGFPFVKSVETVIDWNVGTLRCGGSDVFKAAIRMARDVPVAEGTPTETVVVAYVVKVVGTVRELHRLVCTSDPLNPDSDIVLVHNLDGNPDAPRCTPSPCSLGTPRFIEWDVDIKSPGSLSGGLTVELSGQRRQT